jgi:hypothetical protein
MKIEPKVSRVLARTGIQLSTSNRTIAQSESAIMHVRMYSLALLFIYSFLHQGNGLRVMGVYPLIRPFRPLIHRDDFNLPFQGTLHADRVLPATK